MKFEYLIAKEGWCLKGKFNYIDIVWERVKTRFQKIQKYIFIKIYYVLYILNCFDVLMSKINFKK
jgi:hypothetical protein